MAATVTTPALMSIEEYLRTSFKPDCHFVDGVVEERTLGELPHSTLHTELAYWFRLNQATWRAKAKTEQRIRVSANKVRVPDICLISDDAPREAVTVTPPILCIEILSPEDRLRRAEKVLEDYRVMGVSQSWLLDPIQQIAYTYNESGLNLFNGDRLELAGTPIYLVLSDLFAALD